MLLMSFPFDRPKTKYLKTSELFIPFSFFVGCGRQSYENVFFTLFKSLALQRETIVKKSRNLMPSSLQILVSSFFVFGSLGCMIFFKMVSVCKAWQARLLKNVNKHFRNFVGQNQGKTKNENGMKSSFVTKSEKRTYQNL